MYDLSSTLYVSTNGNALSTLNLSSKYHTDTRTAISSGAAELPRRARPGVRGRPSLVAHTTGDSLAPGMAPGQLRETLRTELHLMELSRSAKKAKRPLRYLHVCDPNRQGCLTERKLDAIVISASGSSAWIQWLADRIVESENFENCFSISARWLERRKRDLPPPTKRVKPS